MTGNRDLVEVFAHELRRGDRDGSLGVGRSIVTDPQVLAGGRVEFVMAWSNGRKDTARPSLDRRFRVRRTVVGSGLPLRYRGKATTTRGTVEVVDATHPDAGVTVRDTRGKRWAMRCEHGTVVGRVTQRAAMDDVHDPRLWCLQCVGVKPGELVLPL